MPYCAIAHIGFASLVLILKDKFCTQNVCLFVQTCCLLPALAPKKEENEINGLSIVLLEVAVTDVECNTPGRPVCKFWEIHKSHKQAVVVLPQQLNGHQKQCMLYVVASPLQSWDATDLHESFNGIMNFPDGHLQV